MRTKGNCTTKWQSGAKLFSLALAGVRKRRHNAQTPATQPVPHAGHLYTTHDMDTSVAAGWLEARGGPDPARGRSDPSAGDARISSAMGVAGDGARQWRPLPGDTTPAPSLPNLLSTRPRDAVACSSLPNPPHHAPLPVNIGFYFPILISSSARKKHGEDSEGRWQ